MIGPLSYVGGKNRLANKIIPLIPPHRTYVEAFAGGAQVLFHKTPSPVEILNDLDFDIANFFRVCQRHYEELLRYLRFTLVSRRWFELLQAENPESLTDIERASRFFYLQKNCFGGLVLKRAYHYAKAKQSNFNPRRVPEIIAKTHERLANVQIESSPYEEILKRYDGPDSFFYLDPPYFGRYLYRFNFQPEDFLALQRHLAVLRGKFILSLNDCAFVRRAFSGFHIHTAGITYTATRDATKRFTELLITNVDTKASKRPTVRATKAILAARPEQCTRVSA